MTAKGGGLKSEQATCCVSLYYLRIIGTISNFARTSGPENVSPLPLMLLRQHSFAGRANGETIAKAPPCPPRGRRSVVRFRPLDDQQPDVYTGHKILIGSCVVEIRGRKSMTTPMTPYPNAPYNTTCSMPWSSSQTSSFRLELRESHCSNPNTHASDFLRKDPGIGYPFHCLLVFQQTPTPLQIKVYDHAG